LNKSPAAAGLFHREARVSLIDYLDQYRKTRLPMHMPGHKRNASLAGYLARLGADLDVTEAEGLDNLHDAAGILKDGMEKAAALWGSGRAFWLVNGSSCGILAGVWAASPDGGAAVCARNCHRSVLNALILRRARAFYVMPETDEAGIAGPLSPDAVASALDDNPDARLVIVTSPTYEGVLSNIPEICRVAHARGAAVLVDEAHGAHLGFGHGFPDGAVRAGADIAVQSLHKTLPSLTQTALLHVNGNRIDAEAVRAALSVFETSSPSYLLMASIDGCAELLRTRGDALFSAWREGLSGLEKRLSALKHLSLGAGAWPRDPSKVVIRTDKSDIGGMRLMEMLRARGIEPEMAAPGYVVLMTGMGDTDATLSALAEALLDIDGRIGSGRLAPLPPLPLPTRVLSPWEAALRASETVKLADAAGRVCAEAVWAYPPGIPLVVPGEALSAEIARAVAAVHGRDEIRVLSEVTLTNRTSGDSL
jgi:arginine/lysine/ornithine decarboxylase